VARVERTIKAAVVIALAAVLLLFVGRLLVNGLRIQTQPLHFLIGHISAFVQIYHARRELFEHGRDIGIGMHIRIEQTGSDQNILVAIKYLIGSLHRLQDHGSAGDDNRTHHA
jgi:hypothetical protein